MERIKSLLTTDSDDMTVSLKQWKEVDKFLQLTTTETTVVSLLEEIDAKFKHYKLHRYLMKVQPKFISDLKQNQPDDNCIIYKDFSQNYEARTQNEVSTAYFGRRQISLFTVAVFIGQRQMLSFAIVNDHLAHDSAQVYYDITEILKRVKEEQENLKHVVFYTDGCGQQFKNKFYLSN
jgi:hypothetical protein